MAYSISQTDPDAMSTEELLAEIDGFKVLAVEVVERLAFVLKTLRKRRQPHAYFNDRILRFWESIANQTLSAEAAILLANRNTINAVLPLSRQEQIEIAKGREIAIANRLDDGDIKIEHMPINRMDRPTLARVFGPTGIRSIEEQARILREAGRVQKIGLVTVLKDEHCLKIGTRKIRPEDLRGPLAALGYRLTLARDEKVKAG